MNATVKAKAVKPSKFRTEADVLKELGLAKKETLSKAEHTAIANAAKEASRSLRKANPKAAQQLYYVHYKHSGNAKKAAAARK